MAVTAGSAESGLIVCDDGHLGLFDVTAERNAFGRQLQSFEADLEVEGLGAEPLRLAGR